MNIKKKLFPFFDKEKHNFLLEKWWFRTVIVFYIIAMPLLLIGILSGLAESAWVWCYKSTPLSITNDIAFNFDAHVKNCNEIRNKNFASVMIEAPLITAAIHYFIQFIFFKIVINFIVLGGNKRITNEK